MLVCQILQLVDLEVCVTLAYVFAVLRGGKYLGLKSDESLTPKSKSIAILRPNPIDKSFHFHLCAFGLGLSWSFMPRNPGFRECVSEELGRRFVAWI
jgi:hypothetical protein